MPIVLMPDGTAVEMPDRLTPEQAAKLRQMQHTPALENPWPKVVEVGKKGLQAGLRGALKGSLSAAEGLLGSSALDASGQPVQHPLFAAGEKALDRFIPPVQTQTPLGRIGVAAAEGAGAALSGPGSLSAPVRAALAGGAAGGAAGAAFEILPEGLKAPGAAATGLLVGPLAGFAFGPRQAPADRSLRRAMQGTPEADWQAAERNLQTFSQAGAKTATLGEAFPPGHAIGGLTEKARGQAGAEELTARLGNRQADLQALANQALQQVGGPTNVAATAAKAAQTADAALERLMKIRTYLYTRTMRQTQPMAPEEAATIAQRLQADLQSSPKLFESKLYREAYQEVFDALKHPDKVSIPQPPKTSIGTVGKAGFKVLQTEEQPPREVAQFKTSVPAAAGELKQAQTNANPLSMTGGEKLNQAAVSRGYGVVNKGLREVDPAYAAAEQNYARFSEERVNPALRGPLGILSGRFFETDRPIPPARLEGAFKGSPPAEIENTLQRLDKASPGLAGEIARAIVQQKLHKGSMNVGQTLRGLPGSEAEQGLEALVRAGGRSPAPLKQTLETSDALQRFQNSPGSAGDYHVSLAEALFRPFRTGGIIAQGAKEQAYYREIARMLSNPTPEGLARLKEIAMFDPEVRRRLMLSSAIGGLIGGSQ